MVGFVVITCNRYCRRFFLIGHQKKSMFVDETIFYRVIRQFVYTLCFKADEVWTTLRYVAHFLSNLSSAVDTNTHV